MKALTLWQPWASLVALGVKTIETRSWSTDYRGPLAIHAAAGERWREGSRTHRARLYSRDARPMVSRLPFGAVVAICTLVDVVPVARDLADVARLPRCVYRGANEGKLIFAQRATPDDPAELEDITDQLPYGDYTPGRYAWLLTDIKCLDEPVPARGRQRLWNWIETS